MRGWFKSGPKTTTPTGFGIVPLLLLGAAAMLICGGGLIVHAGQSINDLTESREQALLDRAIDRKLAKLDADIEYLAVWTEGYAKAALGFDRTWVHENFGQYLGQYMGHSRTLMVSADGRLLYAAEGGKTVPLTDMKAFSTAVAPMVRQVAAEGRAGQARYRHRRAVVASLDGVFLVAAGSLAPEAGYRGALAGGDEPITVSAVRMDSSFLKTMAEDYGIEGLKLGAPGSGRLALAGPDGAPAASFDWVPLKPGQAVVFHQARMTFAGIGACLLLLIVLVILRVRSIAAHLKASAEAAKAADRAKSVFLANMSHEIRTPLNAVLGMAQVMEADELSGAQRERLGLIRESGQVLLGVLNDVLDLSRIEAGQLTISPAPFELGGLAEGTLNSFQGQAGAKGLKLVLAIDADPESWWRGDPQRIRQILSNLISNAVKFTEAGEVALAISRTPAGLVFSVLDTGPGIAPEHLATLFGRFAQADDSITRKHGGTGLGLAISRELAELMGGVLTASSEVGKGSVFTLTLPLPEIAAEAPAPTAAPVELDRRVRVLAAEDNAANRRVLAALLQPLDVELEMVSDGVELLEAYGRGRPDVVLADIQMPRMGGVEAARAIRLLEVEQGRARTPIVALTANVMTDQVRGYLDAGMDAHLAKPIQVGELVRVLGAVLAGEPEEEQKVA